MVITLILLKDAGQLSKMISIASDDFHNGSVCLQSINGSHITLIPKVDAPSHPSDFRLISLLNTSIKIITKLLSNRLQKIMQVVHQNQYGFIKGRTIQDYVA